MTNKNTVYIHEVFRQSPGNSYASTCLYSGECLPFTSMCYCLLILRAGFNLYKLQL